MVILTDHGLLIRFVTAIGIGIVVLLVVGRLFLRG